MILKSNKLVNVCRSVEKGAFKDPYIVKCITALLFKVHKVLRRSIHY